MQETSYCFEPQGTSFYVFNPYFPAMCSDARRALKLSAFQNTIFSSHVTDQQDFQQKEVLLFSKQIQNTKPSEDLSLFKVPTPNKVFTTKTCSMFYIKQAVQITRVKYEQNSSRVCFHAVKKC